MPPNKIPLSTTKQRIDVGTAEREVSRDKMGWVGMMGSIIDQELVKYQRKRHVFALLNRKRLNHFLLSEGLI